MNPQDVLQAIGVLAGGLAVFGMGLGLLAAAIHDRGSHHE